MSSYPDFAIIGAAKAGTTALFDILAGHPEIFLPAVKEPHHFAFRFDRPDLVAPDGRFVGMNERAISDPDEYLKLFRSRGPGQIAGEASVSTLNYSRSIDVMRDANPRMKAIAILRNPADRAYSAFNHARRWGIETERDFSTALDLEAARVENDCPLLMRYVSGGRYATLLAPFVEEFGPDRLHLILYDDFRADPDAVIVGLLKFLGVDPTIALDTDLRSNSAVVPREGNRLHSFINSDSVFHQLNRAIVPWSVRRRVVRAVKPRLFDRPDPMTTGQRSRITTELADEITRLAGDFGVDCQHWLAESRAA